MFCAHSQLTVQPPIAPRGLPTGILWGDLSDAASDSDKEEGQPDETEFEVIQAFTALEDDHLDLEEVRTTSLLIRI